MSNAALPEKEFDLIVYGASGFTGKLVSEYLFQQHGNNVNLRWALAGRNAEKIARSLAEARLPSDTPVITADSGDLEALTAMTERTSVVLSTVGPYQYYGTLLVEACVKTGTDYVDLCGEPVLPHDEVGEVFQRGCARCAAQ